MRKNKKGSYIVEASITLPVLIISICSLILIIKIIALCEAVTFMTSNHLIDTMFGYNVGFSEKTLCDNIKKEYPDISDYKVTRYRYLYDAADTKDLISIEAEANFKVVNSIGINGNIKFNENILCRGFTGNTQEYFPLEESFFLEYKSSFEVYVFPRYGEKYHASSCRYVKNSDMSKSYMMKLDREDASRKGYTPCAICQGAANEK